MSFRNPTLALTLAVAGACFALSQRARKPVWQARPLGIETVRAHAHEMELAAVRFYRRATARSVRRLDPQAARRPCAAEVKHEHAAERSMKEDFDRERARTGREGERRRMLVLRFIQPGLAGLMDGSVSTLAPVFAAAFATRNSWNAFLVGIAASIGAGISMGFAEALSDDGSLTGRGAPLLRGVVCGLMTTAAASAIRCRSSSRTSTPQPQSP